MPAEVVGAVAASAGAQVRFYASLSDAWCKAESQSTAKRGLEKDLTKLRLVSGNVSSVDAFSLNKNLVFVDQAESRSVYLAAIEAALSQTKLDLAVYLTPLNTLLIPKQNIE